MTRTAPDVNRHHAERPGTTPKRPRAEKVLPGNIPLYLREKAQWVVWRYTWSDQKGKWDKPPLCPHTLRLASTTDRETWATFKEAVGAYLDPDNDLDGIGFVILPEDNLTGIDLDHCRDPKTGVILQWAQDIIDRLDSYTEVTPSGTGLRAFARAKKPGREAKKGGLGPDRQGAIEMYDGLTREYKAGGRYLTVTGRLLPQTKKGGRRSGNVRIQGICDRQKQINHIYFEVFGRGENGTPSRKRKSDQPKPSRNGKPKTSRDRDDADIVRRAKRDKRTGERFRRLWKGDYGGYPSRSEADQALCNLLAGWVDDPERIDRLFRESGLYRDKWETQSYRETTIRKALEERPDAGRGKALDDPDRLARAILDQEIQQGTLILRYWRDQWVRWDGAAYRAVPRSEMEAMVVRFINDYFDRYKSKKRLKVTGNLVSNVMMAMRSMAILPESVTPPSWIDSPTWMNPRSTDQPPFEATDVVVTRNHLIHLPSFESRSGLIPPTPRFFTENALDYTFERRVAKPTEWLHFLSMLWKDDQASIDLLQEWFGYCVTTDTSQHKILFMVGPPRSGRSTIGRVLTGVVGEANVAGPTLSSLRENFGLMPLLGKSLAIISDARFSGQSSQNCIVERLLSISGEDRIVIDRKQLQPITVKLNTRIVIISNELPELTDASGALASRLLVLHTPKSWRNHEDPTLTRRLLAERPGILRWAIEGWRRLSRRGHFVQPKSGADLLQEITELSSPVTAFVRERCVLGRDLQISKSELYKSYTAWCERRGQIRVPTDARFGRDLLAAFPQVRCGRPRKGGLRQQVYTGIALPDDREPGWRG